MSSMGEKQLFEKFWRGTFKAVASPRPESIIAASITAGRARVNTVVSTCHVKVADKEKGEPPDVEAKAREVDGCVEYRRLKRGSCCRLRSVSYNKDLTSPPKGKKKKKKSQRKKKRKRSLSYSLSPVRKKKKKSSKKRKHKHGSSSKKRRDGCSSPKRKRKEEKKHKKRSQSRSHRRHRHHRSESKSSSWCSSSAESRQLHRTTKHIQSGSPTVRSSRHLSARPLESKHGLGSVSTCKDPAPSCKRTISSDYSIGHCHSGGDILPSVNGRHPDYDSGNDTSSPPSTKTDMSRSKVSEDKKGLCAIGLLEKWRLLDGDNASDSGNSVTSYSSLCKPLLLERGSSTCTVNANKRFRKSAWERPQSVGFNLDRSKSHVNRQTGSHSCSRSRSRSSHSSGFTPRSSCSSSPSSERRSYSRSSNSSTKPRKRKRSVESDSSCQSPSYSSYRENRVRELERSCKKYSSLKQRTRRERRQQRSYTPMRKRRRNSPSHLEARRITSARKKPIPYYRPSPSASSPSTTSSRSSIFTCCSRNSSSSYSRSRSYSRSSSWSSLSHRSHSYDSVSSYSRH